MIHGISSTKGELNIIRRQGGVPGNLYGKSMEPISLYIQEDAFQKLAKQNAQRILKVMGCFAVSSDFGVGPASLFESKRDENATGAPTQSIPY